MSSSSCTALSNLGADLLKECLESSSPSVDRCHDILRALEETNSKNMTIALLEKTKIGKTLSKSLRSMKRHRRGAMSDDGAMAERWDGAVTTCDRLLTSWRRAADAEAARRREPAAAESESAREGGLPSSASQYRSRLTRQKKEMYKDPPVLPPSTVTVRDGRCGPTARRGHAGELVYAVAGADDDAAAAALLKSFRPNLDPEQVLRGGAFGGTYFRPISSAVTNLSYRPKDVLASTVRPSWISGLNASTHLTSSTYRANVNRYGAKCGGSLGMWESSGWISDADPYGWFQWYCRFHAGRRTSDDARQIGRWAKIAGEKGRFRSQLCNKILKARTTADDVAISPVIRQTLWHWGLEVTDDVLEKHRKRVEGK